MQTDKVMDAADYQTHASITASMGNDSLPFVFVECLEISQHSQSVANEVHRQDLIMSHDILFQQAHGKLLYIS